MIYNVYQTVLLTLIIAYILISRWIQCPLSGIIFTIKYSSTHVFSLILQVKFENLTYFSGTCSPKMQKIITIGLILKCIQIYIHKTNMNIYVLFQEFQIYKIFVLHGNWCITRTYTVEKWGNLNTLKLRVKIVFYKHFSQNTFNLAWHDLKGYSLLIIN